MPLPGRRLNRTLSLAVVIAALFAASCGSATPDSPTTVIHVAPSTVMIMATGVDPSEITVAVGERVTFMNHDTVPHSVAGGAEPAQPDCPEINAVGVLAPGELKPTAAFTTAKTCEYHVARPQSTSLRGRIIIR